MAKPDTTLSLLKLRVPMAFEHLDDGELLPLLEEPETYAELSPLERELVVRLGAVWETVRRMDDEAMEAGLYLN